MGTGRLSGARAADRVPWSMRDAHTGTTRTQAMEQPSITAFFAPDADGPDHSEEAVDDHFELGDLSVTFLIYLYRCSATGTPIYVGQTMKKLEDRDYQHLKAQGAPGTFDDVYTDRALFTLEVLTQKTFSAEVQSSDELDRLIWRATAWANAREIEEIDIHCTFDPRGPGLNRTCGGQGCSTWASLRSRFIQMRDRWTNRYRPALEAHLVEFGSLRNLPSGTGQPSESLTLGNLVGRIRNGNAAVPPEHMMFLREHGFRWSSLNVAAHVAGYLDIPRAELPADATEKEDVMQCLHEAARMELFGKLTVPELVVLFNEHRYLHGNPARGPIGGGGDKRGRSESSRPTGQSDCKRGRTESSRASLKVKSIQMHNRWTNHYRPLLEAHVAEFGSLRDLLYGNGQQSLCYHREAKLKSVIGSIRHGRIRNGNAAVPPEHMTFLREHGFRWSSLNVAAHVAGYLDIPRAELPADATEKEDVMQCLHEAARMELFGKLTVPELVVLFNEHRYLHGNPARGPIGGGGGKRS